MDREGRERGTMPHTTELPALSLKTENYFRPRNVGPNSEDSRTNWNFAAPTSVVGKRHHVTGDGRRRSNDVSECNCESGAIWTG